MQCRSFVDHLRRVISLALTLAMLMSCAAFAQESVPLDHIGMRYLPAEGDICLTREDMNPEGLALLGVDEATALAAMQSDNLHLMIFTADGRQVSLRVDDKPAEISADNAHDLSIQDKELLLTLLARGGRYASAAWQGEAHGYAFFSSPAQSAGASLCTLSMSTLYLGKIFSLQTDIVGRDPTEEDRRLLLSAAERLLRLGATRVDETGGEVQNVMLTLPDPSPLVSGQAEITTVKNDIALTLDPVPAISGLTTLSLSGVTEPRAFIRYSINGQTSSRIRADEDGRFSVTVSGLTGNEENPIELSASKDDKAAIVRFSVKVDWQSTPLVIAPLPASIQADSVVLRGLTLPGSKVTLLRKSSSTNLTVQEDGSFEYEISLRAIGELSFTVRAVAPGYRRTDTALALTRESSEQDQLDQLQKKVKSVTYEKLCSNPSAYEGRILRTEGTVAALSNPGGAPSFLLKTEDGSLYIYQCQDLLDIEPGQTVDVLGELTGQKAAIQSPEFTGSYPSLTLLLQVSH